MAEQIRTALLRRKEVEAEVALARSAIRRRISAGTFPRPVSLGGPLCVRWRREEIDTWIANPSGYRAPEAA
jgi:prophage regulatory protein